METLLKKVEYATKCEIIIQILQDHYRKMDLNLIKDLIQKLCVFVLKIQNLKERTILSLKAAEICIQLKFKRRGRGLIKKTLEISEANKDIGGRFQFLNHVSELLYQLRAYRNLKINYPILNSFIKQTSQLRPWCYMGILSDFIITFVKTRDSSILKEMIMNLGFTSYPPPF